MRRLEVRFAGLGGQGIITASKILGQAVALYDGKYAVQTQSYGPEARGSACIAQVVISNEHVDYPKPINPDVLVLMSQEAYDSHGQTVKDDGILITDSEMVRPFKVKPKVKFFTIPATKVAEEEFNHRIVANVIMLGAFTAITQSVSQHALEKSLKQMFPKHYKVNKKAFQLGIQLGKEALKTEEK